MGSYSTIHRTAAIIQQGIYDNRQVKSDEQKTSVYEIEGGEEGLECWCKYKNTRIREEENTNSISARLLAGGSGSRHRQRLSIGNWSRLARPRNFRGVSVIAIGECSYLKRRRHRMVKSKKGSGV